VQIPAIQSKVCTTKARVPCLPSFVWEWDSSRSSSEAARVWIVPCPRARSSRRLWSRTSLHPSPYTPARIEHWHILETGSPAQTSNRRRSLHTDQRFGITTDPAACRSTFFHAHLQSHTTSRHPWSITSRLQKSTIIIGEPQHHPDLRAAAPAIVIINCIQGRPETGLQQP
jgi:hypothetical protein